VLKPIVVSLLVVTAFAGTASASPRGGGADVAYRATLNRVCRSYTPRMKTAAARLRQARAEGDAHAFAYEFGVLLGASYAEGLILERTPVPTDLKAQMALPLRLVHQGDAQVHVALKLALAGQIDAAIRATASLSKLNGPTNHALDAVGLRDCGSNQS
jgi:hypothetical protein